MKIVCTDCDTETEADTQTELVERGWERGSGLALACDDPSICGWHCPEHVRKPEPEPEPEPEPTDEEWEAYKATDATVPTNSAVAMARGDTAVVVARETADIVISSCNRACDVAVGNIPATKSSQATDIVTRSGYVGIYNS